MKKAVSGIILALLLIGSLTLAFDIQPLEAEPETIYIRANGSIDPPTANITTSDNFTYTFTSNINDSIVVERNNIVIDGAGCILQGTGATHSYGIDLTGRNNITVRNTKITRFESGVYVVDSNNIMICNNTITRTTSWGILLYVSNKSTISHNTVINNEHSGIQLEISNNVLVYNNHVKHNSVGVLVYESRNTTVQDNVAENNTQGIGLRNIYEEYGGITVLGNEIASNYQGIHLSVSFNNTLLANTLVDNEYGVYLDYSSDNMIYHNNFINNINQAVSGLANTWDDGFPSGGNFWSNYNGTDLFHGPNQSVTGSDGMGDTQYVIDENNADNYPFMAPFITFDAGTWNRTSHNVNVVTNSTVYDFYFNPTSGTFILLEVICEPDTSAFFRITIPKDLLWVEDGWNIYVGSTRLDYTAIEDDANTYLHFAFTNTFQHPNNGITINGTHVIPEFPLLIILPLFIITTLLAVILYRRKHST